MFCDKGAPHCKVVGQIYAIAGAPIYLAPLTNAPCVFYQAEVSEHRHHHHNYTADGRTETRHSSHWVPVVYEQVCNFLRDEKTCTHTPEVMDFVALV